MYSCIDHQKTGNLSKEGYARVSKNGKKVRLPRLVYCQEHSLGLEDIREMLVLHSCDNPRCINPDNLRLGTQQDNMRDKVVRKRTHNRKFSDKQIISIRERYTNTNISIAALAEQNGVTYLSMFRILHKETYYDV